MHIYSEFGWTRLDAHGRALKAVSYVNLSKNAKKEYKRLDLYNIHQTEFAI